MDAISLNVSLRVCLQVLNVAAKVKNLTQKYRMVKLLVYICVTNCFGVLVADQLLQLYKW